jgi:hypothetical protein
MLPGSEFTMSGVTGTGADITSLNGTFVATAGTTKSTLNYTIATGLTITTVTGGSAVGPHIAGVAVDGAPYLRLANNRIGDYQATKAMQVAVTGTWGTNGLCEGNYYGPRIASGGLSPADNSVYDTTCVMGFNYDLVNQTVYADALVTGQIAFGGNVSNVTSYPNQGMSMGWNYSGGQGEVDLFLGQGAGGVGGLDVQQVTNAGTVNTAVGVSGSLVKVDGYGNLRIGGAQCHGSLQKQTLLNGNTLTVNANTDFVYVANGASIATGTVTLPVASFGANAYQEVEILFAQQVGALTVNAAGTYTVQNAPTSVTVNSTSFAFILDGTVWRRRILS